jgi:hypothetical protein
MRIYKAVKIHEFHTADKRMLLPPDKELHAIKSNATFNNITKTGQMIRRN